MGLAVRTHAVGILPLTVTIVIVKRSARMCFNLSPLAGLEGNWILLFHYTGPGNFVSSSMDGSYLFDDHGLLSFLLSMHLRCAG